MSQIQTRVEQAATHLELDRILREQQIVHHMRRAAHYRTLCRLARHAAEDADTQRERVAFHEEADRYRSESELSNNIALEFAQSLGFLVDPLPLPEQEQE